MCNKRAEAKAFSPITTQGNSDLSSGKAIVHGIDGRYASALFDLADTAGKLDAVEKDLATLGALLQESADFATLVESPVISRDEQMAAVAGVAKVQGFIEMVGNFLGVLAKNGRLAHLAGTIKNFNALLSHSRGEVSAKVVSAKALSKKQHDALKKSLKEALGQDVAIEALVDETLLGGLTVQVGSRMVDSSLKSKLENLKVTMKGV